MYKIEFLVSFQAHFVQTWQPPLLQWMKTYTKSIFATGLHKANFVQIRFFVQCKACNWIYVFLHPVTTEIRRRAKRWTSNTEWSRRSKSWFPRPRCEMWIGYRKRWLVSSKYVLLYIELQDVFILRMLFLFIFS